MSLEISAGATLFTMLLDGKLYNGRYLSSYSVDSYNPYHLYSSDYYATSGYFVSVSTIINNFIRNCLFITCLTSLMLVVHQYLELVLLPIMLMKHK